MGWDAIRWLWPLPVALAVSGALTPAVRALARHFGAVARPRADRYHQRPTALLGGIAIFGAFAAAFALQWPTSLPRLLWAVGCAVAMFGLGLLDDLWSFRPLTKLVGQVAVAAAYTWAGPRLVYTFIGPLDVVITVVWLVGITNALNLLDNLDGLAAGVAAIAALFLSYFFWQAGLPAEAGVMLAMAGAALGFLVYNWSPASIFMGDCGSLFLGFLLASVTLLNESHRTRNLLATLGVPLLILLVPILDTTLVTFARRAHGRAVSQGGTDHLSHRLVALGFSDRATVTVIYLVAIASGAVAVLVRQLSIVMSIALVVLFLAVLVTGLLVVIRVRVYGAPAARAARSDASPPADAEATPAVAPRRGWRRWLLRFPLLLLGYDLLAVVFCYYLAFLLRFGDNPLPFLRVFVGSLPVVVAVQLALLWASGLYGILWHRISAWDVARLGVSVLMAVAGSVAAVTLLYRFELMSRAAFVIDGVLLFLALLFGRYAGRATRMLSSQQDRQRDARTLLLGAGAAADAAGRELRESARWQMRPVGYLDDDPTKVGRRIRGLPVIGTLADLEGVVRANQVQRVLLAIRELPPEVVESLRSRCARMGVPLYRLRLEIEPVAEGDRAASLDAVAPAAAPHSAWPAASAEPTGPGAPADPDGGPAAPADPGEPEGRQE
jgi:UDP-GlcNAc:undecaprenyl-phosphate GlcNAc-1-phosphate transferase